jgi:hypothetical protein
MKVLRVGFVPLFFLAILAVFTAQATGQVAEGQIQTRIRPIVYLRYSGTVGGTPETRTAVGIFDTGDPADTFSRETASLLGIPAVTPLNPQAAFGPQNQGTTAAQTITSGGWLGGVFNPPERTSVAVANDPQVRAGDPAHVFQNANTARTAPVASAGIRPWYLDYNNRFSENHTGTSFVSRANPAENLVAFIDPINATPLPFAYDNTNGGNGRGLAPAGLPLDQRGSSVSYLTNNDPRVPIPGAARNDNPGFVHFIPLTPREFASTTLTPAAASAVVNAGLPVGVDRRLTLTVANADGPNVARVVPQDFGGLAPGYRPADAVGTTLFGVTGFQYEVRNANLAIGGQVNPNGFERRDGTVQVVVRQTDGTVRLTQTVNLPSQAPLTFGQINIPALGINTGAAALIDTGAPATTPGVIVGTDVLNRFGQFFDFSRGPGGEANLGTLTLIGPTDPRIRELRANGILFNVDRNTVGLARTAVEQEALFGSIPQLQANPLTGGAGANTVQGGTAPPEAHGTVFRTHLTGSNASYIDEAAHGLNRGGQAITGLSLGADRINLPKNTKLFFSVDPASVGLDGTAVNGQALRNQAASDVFEIPFHQATPFPVRGGNTLTINQEVMGLGSNFGPAALATPSRDNLTDFDLYTQHALPSRSLSNLDSPITAAGDRGTADRPRVGDDVLARTFDTYFTLETGPDILRSNLATVFAQGVADIGLAALDVLDGFALFRPSVMAGVIGKALERGLAVLSTNLEQNPANGGFTFDHNFTGEFRGIDMFQGQAASDLALFSLARGSPTLQALRLSAADIFITDFDGTFTLFASAESLGLRFDDNVDGLDSIATPEPGTLVLLGLGGLGLLWSRGRRSRGIC